jgi:ubiquitin-like protein Pup
MVQETHETSKSNADEEVVDDAQLRAAQDAGHAALENVDVEAIDTVLKEIDDVLETNAEAFVENFVQKGGQ